MKKLPEKKEGVVDKMVEHKKKKKKTDNQTVVVEKDLFNVTS